MTTASPAPAPKPKLAGGFLAGAGGRLLPASIPFRYFGAAVVFHLLAWLALLAGTSQWSHWRSGLGWPLAALHLITLGTLLGSAIGASLQLLPVATREPVHSERAAAALWWAYVPGVAVLALGMGLARPLWVAAGAAVVLAALAVYAVLLALNLRGARGMPGVVLHGWGAMVALVLLALSAAALVALWLGAPVIGRDIARSLHGLAGVFGVMGLLVFGLASILLPMFVLAPMPEERSQLAAAAAALAAIGLAAVAALGVLPLVLRALALAAGAAALALHLRAMQRVIAGGMRRDLGRALLLMRIAWAALIVALIFAAATLVVDDHRLGRLFVIAAVGGWLLSFLFGVLQRILPFLASMHAGLGRKRPPTPSSLTLDAPLNWHLAAHLAALMLLASATLTGSALLAALAAAVGAAGALAFGVFFVVLMARLRRAIRSGHQPRP
jgi:hypothetical protein